MKQQQFNEQFDEFVRQSTDGRYKPTVQDQAPIITDDTPMTSDFCAAYLMHCAWATRVLFETRPQIHCDFGSYVYFVSMASAFIPDFRFYDIRPAHIVLPNLQCLAGDLTALTMADNSLPSISCMHVIEHIGLGRYGDAIDAQGDLKAASELARVLQPGGQLLYVAPMNQQAKVRFNSHRHYTYDGVLSMFPGLKLIEFTLADDDGLIVNADPKRVKNSNGNVDSTGCFRFVKPTEASPVAPEPVHVTAIPPPATHASPTVRVFIFGTGQTKELMRPAARSLVEKKAAKYV